jgi:simple sugar transport system permease protein
MVAARPVVLVLAASVVVFLGLVVVFTDVGPWQSITGFARGSFGSVDALSETLTRAIPLVLVGVGASIALRGGVFNVGGESQMAMGAVAAAIVIQPLSSLPVGIVWPIAALAGAVGGALWVVVPTLLWLKRGVSEILSTLLVNFVTAALLAWLLANTFLHDPDPAVITPQGEPIDRRFHLPLLIHGSRLHAGIYLTVLLVLLTTWVMRTVVGFRVDLVGESPSLAAQAGIRATRLRAGVLLMSAAFAGLAGSIQLLGLSHRLTTGLTGGVGYTGLLVAVLGRSRPVAVATAAVVFAALVTGGEALERDGVPRTLSAVVQAVLIVGVALATRRGERS